MVTQRCPRCNGFLPATTDTTPPVCPKAAQHFDDELMTRLQHEGRSAREIAAAVGCSERTVTRWRSRTDNRVTLPPPSHPESDRELARRLLFEDECSIAEAARTIGAAPSTVARWFPDAPRCDQAQILELGRIGRQFAALERRRAA